MQNGKPAEIQIRFLRPGTRAKWRAMASIASMVCRARLTFKKSASSWLDWFSQASSSSTPVSAGAGSEASNSGDGALR